MQTKTLVFRVAVTVPADSNLRAETLRDALDRAVEPVLQDVADPRGFDSTDYDVAELKTGKGHHNRTAERKNRERRAERGFKRSGR